MSDRRAEIEQRLALRSQGVDMRADWDDLVWLLEENQRLREAGRKMIPGLTYRKHDISPNSPHNSWCSICGVCLRYSDHRDDCPSSVFRGSE